MEGAPRKYLPEIDAVRGIAIACLVLTHTAAYFIFNDRVNWLVRGAVYTDILTSFVVPAFVIISGIVLMRRHSLVERIWKFYQGRMASVIPQYLTFSTLYVIIDVLYLGFALSFTIIGYYFAGGAYYHLWFFVLLIQLYLIYPFLASAYRRFASKIGYILVVLLVFQIVYNLTLLWLCDASGDPTVQRLLFRRTFPSYIFYFVFGMYVGANYESFLERIRRLNPVPILLGIIGLSALMTFNWLSLISVPEDFNNLSYMSLWADKVIEPFLFVMTFLLVLKVAGSIRAAPSKIFFALGKESFGIFLIHPAFMLLTIELLALITVSPGNLIFYPLTFIITLTLSYATIRAIRAVPGSKWVIGQAR
jgi:peptidoglycan/LPS O-acetylase OafA/YrhL